MLRSLQFSLLAVIAGLLINSAAMAASGKDIGYSLQKWMPLSVSVTETTNSLEATVVSKEPMVSQDLYLSMMHALCQSVITSPGALQGLGDVVITNNSSKQGFVFLGGEQQCAEYLTLPDSAQNNWLLSKTNSF